jgi:hypothetical protein
MPILFVNGTNDFAYPLDSYMKSVDAVPGDKQICITVKMPHSHPAGWAPQEIGLFIDHHLRDGQPLASLGAASITEGKVHATCRSGLPVDKVQLHYTTDTKPINQREWHTASGRFESEVITAVAPPEGTTAWFMTVTDAHGAIVSSGVRIE